MFFLPVVYSAMRYMLVENDLTLKPSFVLSVFTNFIYLPFYSYCMNIYIGNLNYRVREAELKQILEEYGAVDSVKVIIDRETNRSKGFAFAEMPNTDEAQHAIKELAGAEYEGRNIVIREAMPRR